MRQYLVFLIIPISLITSCNDSIPEAESVKYENIYLVSQADVDEFSKEGVVKIEGHLTIGGAESDIISLDGLTSLKVITGGLSITNNNELIKIEGLSSLASVDWIQIRDNKALQEIQSFNDLKMIYSLGIMNNPDLDIINGFSGLQKMDFAFFSGNKNLREIQGFSEVEEMGNLEIADNPELKQVEAFANLSLISGELRLIKLGSIQSFAFLSNMIEAGSILIDDISQLSNLGLIRLKKVNGSMQIGNVPLFNFKGLENLESICGTLKISSSLFQSLEGLNNLTNILRGFKISRCDLLQSLNGFENLYLITNDSSLSEGINLQKNPALSNYCALNNLFENSGTDFPFILTDNFFNPSYQDLKNGNCSN